MGSRYANADEDHKLLYIDANKLYAWAMMEYQPYGGFDVIIPDREITKEEILSWEDEHEIGFFLEVDLDYSEEIQFKNKNFPFCPQSIFIEEEDSSSYQRNLILSRAELAAQDRGTKLNTEATAKTENLILTQTDKKNYIVHYRMLNVYLQQGMILKKVHKLIVFKQSNWLKTYIEFNTKQRMTATTYFEKDFFKLMSNAFYGKTCEDIRKRKEVHLVTDEKNINEI
jgi:hypothetical protein